MRWQFAARLLPEAIFGMPYVNGSMLLISRGMAGATGNWYSGLDEVHEMGFVAHVLGEEDLFIDVGANIGSYSILAAAGCKCKVVAFEPGRDAFSILQRNVKVNNLEDLIELHRLAVSDSSGSIRFSTGHDTTNHVLPNSGAPESDFETVPAARLDDVLPERYAALSKVIKVDVEGYELNVLKGAERILNSDTLLALIVEINGSSARYSRTDEDILDYLQSLGLKAFKYDAISASADGPSQDNVITSENLIFTRDLGRIQERVKSRRGKTKLSNGYV